MWCSPAQPGSRAAQQHYLDPPCLQLPPVPPLPQVARLASDKHGGEEGLAEYWQAKLDARMQAKLRVGWRAGWGWVGQQCGSAATQLHGLAVGAGGCIF